MTRVRVVPPVLGVLLALLALTLPLAHVAEAQTRSASRPYAVLTFDKNPDNALRSRLAWRVYVVRDGRTRTLAEESWRAGSGASRHATNACRRNVGWLPNGRYRPRLFADYPGRLIKGRAIYLGGHACQDGTVRTELFIHTEQGAGNVQCPDAPGDQPCRWEYPRINDYRSLGCVKLSPGDMRELYEAWRRWFPSGSADRVRVRVVS